MHGLMYVIIVPMLELPLERQTLEMVQILPIQMSALLAGSAVGIKKTINLYVRVRILYDSSTYMNSIHV